MKLIIGLGNPGEKYHNNRHNVGHMFVDWIKESSWGAERLHDLSDSGQARMTFIKTTVFVNQSGAEVKKLLIFYKLTPSDLIVVHDDLDLQLGKFKIQLGGGPKLHNGVNSIERVLKTSNFWRARIGVDNRDPERRIEGEKYVLQNFLPREKAILPEIFKKAVDKLQNVFHNELIK